jgi:hypothetical protein
MEKLITVRLFNGSDVGKEISINPEHILKIEDVFEETGFESIFFYSEVTLTDGTIYKVEENRDKISHLIRKE